jgi:hypothetical protein
MPSSFYATHSVYSEPGPFREILMRGGEKPIDIARWINSFLQHPRSPESQKRGFASEQARDLELRLTADILAAAMARNLFDRNPTAAKVGAVCRDFALLAVSSFRERGVPARLRVGFADYIAPGCWEDHWLCEWRVDGRWTRLDVEFAVVKGLPFETTDVPREHFVTAADAWFRIRKEPKTAFRFGVSSLGLSGEWFVAGSLFRDMCALRKLELKPWDYWAPSSHLSRDATEWPRQAWVQLDQLAHQLNADLHDDREPTSLADRLLPQRIVSFPYGEPLMVELKKG